MTEQEFIHYITNAIRTSFDNTKQGKADDKHKYRTEGLIHAARLLDVLPESDIHSMIEQQHMRVFNETVSERKARKRDFDKLKDESPDDYYEIPAVERKR